MKILKIIITIILAIVVLIIITGTIKFNFSDSDIIMPEKPIENISTSTTIATTTIDKPSIKSPIQQTSITSKTWKMFDTQYKNYERFSITFKNNKTVSITTDCNGMGGNYEMMGNKLYFKEMMSTMMYCEGSSEQDFSQKINKVNSYSIVDNILTLKYDGGELNFK